MRRTYQREVILEELRQTMSHPSAAELYERVRQRIPHLSFGTVYRNLKLLKEQGVVLELSMGSSASLWDGNAAPHYHFLCQSCSGVQDLLVPLKMDCEREIEAETGLKITGHRAEFYGLCQECQPGSRRLQPVTPVPERVAQAL